MIHFFCYTLFHSPLSLSHFFLFLSPKKTERERERESQFLSFLSTSSPIAVFLPSIFKNRGKRCKKKEMSISSSSHFRRSSSLLLVREREREKRKERKKEKDDDSNIFYGSKLLNVEHLSSFHERKNSVTRELNIINPA